MMLYPTVVLLPQWVIDDIARAIDTLDESSDRFLFTDEMRANGWTRDVDWRHDVHDGAPLRDGTDLIP